jgi:hypothetical protein
MDGGRKRLPNKTRSSERAQPDALLVTGKQGATMCGKSLRTWRTWDSAGLIPRPVRIAHSKLWRADELREWVAAGCPCRLDWEACKRNQHGG